MLSDIIQSVKESVGTDDRTELLRYINRAAREIYDSADLPGSLRECCFTIDSDSDIITLPWFASEPRGMRWPDLHRMITMNDMRPRYHSTPWIQPFLTYTLIGESPLEQNMTEAGLLTVTLAGAETEVVSVTITGQTTTTTLYNETLQFDPGETTKTTTAQFTQAQPFGIKAISKSRITTYDVTVSQAADGRRVATIPNRLKTARNLLIQLRDDNLTATNLSETLEVLFKWPYMELVNDTDMFLDTDKYDDAIRWRVCENYTFKDETKIELTALANQKANALIRRVADNTEGPVEKVIKVAPNPFRRAARRFRYWRRYGGTR